MEDRIRSSDRLLPFYGIVVLIAIPGSRPARGAAALLCRACRIPAVAAAFHDFFP
jgi:hypothetical protein